MSGLWREHKLESTGPAIMKSLHSIGYSTMDSIPRNKIPRNGLQAKCQCKDPRNFLLIDGQNVLRFANTEQFTELLNCSGKDLKVKVVSIFGNASDGKSRMLNQTFFKGENVFGTSNEHSSCTLGVWAAFDPALNAIVLDTKGLFGHSIYDNIQTRLLLEVLAVSDIVICRTQSEEELNRDLVPFLDTASRAYSHHFQTALQAVGQRDGILNSSVALGPSVIVLHESRCIKPFADTINCYINNDLESAENVLGTRFAQMKLETEAFSSIKCVVLYTANYEPLQTTIKKELKNTSVRSARKPHLVFNMLEVLNDKFSGEVENLPHCLFPDQYFTCPVKCLSCGCRCNNSMGHLRDGEPHISNSRCCYQRQYENLVYMCKKCYSNGNEVQMTKRIETQNDNSWYGLIKYAWLGDVIECPHCGEICRSYQYWYGDRIPDDFAVRTEITHVWNTANRSLTSQNTAQKVVDSVSYITEAVTNVSLQSTKVISAWVADQVAPSYWRPNNEIRRCHKCKVPFGPTDTKHHCRACGEGFCSQCSSKTKCVPSRNWHTEVRVCDTCYNKDTNSNEEISGTTDDVNARKISEQVISTLSAVGTVINYSKSLIKDTVRPSYWVPDSEVVDCCICSKKFSETFPLHHCRDCGRGVCQNCSQNQRPVPYRGWDKPVRVCNSCVKIN